MIIENKVAVHVGEVTCNRELRLDSMVNIFQEMAIRHTQYVGVELNNLLDSGKTWVLNRIAIQIKRLPKLNEDVNVSTWSRSITRFKGFRDYEMCIDDELVAAASSLWLYIDLKKGRPVRVPQHYESLYSVENRQSMDVNLEKLDFPKTLSPDFSSVITTRISDYDVNGHVNNAVVLQYIQTGIDSFFGRSDNLENIQIIFQKEIPSNISKLDVIAQETEEGCYFQLQNDGKVFVRGKAIIAQ